jgi:hypothetical protein
MRIFQGVMARKRRAFSMIAVVIIAVSGMALVGGILYTFNSFAGASRQSTSESWEYNVLQEAVEQGKAIVRERMLDENATEPLTWLKPSNGINDFRDLRVISPDGTLIPTPMNVTKISGRDLGGTLSMYILAMDYDPKYNPNGDLDPGIAPAAKALLPPSLKITGTGNSIVDGEALGEDDPNDTDDPGKSGRSAAYLIRAVFVDDNGAEKSIETAIVQSMSE